MKEKTLDFISDFLTKLAIAMLGLLIVFLIIAIPALIANETMNQKNANECYEKGGLPWRQHSVTYCLDVKVIK